MGLFDFLKKPRTDTSTVANKNGNPEAAERTSVFKGDLALISETSTQKKPEPARVAPVSAGQSTENKDSADSVVFMSFTPIKKGWICPECGTKNDEGLNGCIVCGLRK